MRVNEIKCDFLSATGRKFLRGPRGTGFLYVSNRILERNMFPLFIDGKGATWTDTESFAVDQTAKRYQTWEAPYAMVVGLSEAIRYANEIGMKQIEEVNKKISSRLRHNLSVIPGVKMYDRGSRKGSIITFRKEGISLEKTTAHLETHKISCGISHFEWGVIDYRKKGVNWTVRLSPHYFNTLEEMDMVSEIIEAM